MLFQSSVAGFDPGSTSATLKQSPRWPKKDSPSVLQVFIGPPKRQAHHHFEFRRIFSWASLKYEFHLRPRNCEAEYVDDREPSATHKVRIDERRKPQPNGGSNYLLVDMVHQGDWDERKGVNHINAVDQVTQFEVVVPL